ncbi:MAG: DUF421 domain-containing protein [Clostridiaceae bacterium]|nr:DUF421 domain-containing protein [Clostridiaceae bacterium]
MSIRLVILLKSIFMLFLTLFLTRLMGKKNLTKLTPFNIISYIVISIIVVLTSFNIITDFYFGLTILVMWALLPIAFDFLCLKSTWVRNTIQGKETILIKNGKVMEENLTKVRMTGDQFLKELRCRNIFNLAEVEFAIMETTGDINATLKAENKPITSHDLGKKVASKVEPQTVILDGAIINEGLNNTGLNQEWLSTQLQSKGVTLDNVFLGQVDSSGDLYLDIFDDNIEVPKSQVKEMLYANIEKTQADFMSFYLETNNKQAKAMYLKNAEKLKAVMENIEPYLLR